MPSIYRVFLLTLACVGLVQSLPASRLNSTGFVEHERIHKLPERWTLHGEASEHDNLQLRIMLTHPGDDCTQLVEEFSDPFSPKYGQHLTAKELRLMLPSNDKASAAVHKWLRRHQVKDIVDGGDWIEFSTKVSKANKMLNTRFASYSFDVESPVLRTQAYSLPTELIEHIDFIHPTVHFLAQNSAHQPALVPRQLTPPGSLDSTNYTYPETLRAKYNINYYPANNFSGSMIGIASFLGNFPNLSDHKNFLDDYGVAGPGPKSTFESFRESQMIPQGIKKFATKPLFDLDYALSFASMIPGKLFSIGGNGPQHAKSGNVPYFELFGDLVFNEDSIPQVLLITYNDDEQSVPERYAQKVCKQITLLALRGVSVIASSGDGGASGNGKDSSCQGPNNQKRFIPTFPASCTHVTSVGATSRSGGAAGYSSGGLSNYFGRLPWQNPHVASYIRQIGSAHNGYYSMNGRGIPDVSLIGDDYLILENNKPALHSGTSGPAAVFAAMIALLNDLLLRFDKPVLGLLNPLLYSNKMQGVFRDVMDGSRSTGCADGKFSEPGWAALEGWDPATGLGEPDFDKMVQVIADHIFDENPIGGVTLDEFGR